MGEMGTRAKVKQVTGQNERVRARAKVRSRAQI